MTKNDNFKEYGMPVVVLVAICFVTTLLLALTNSVSEPIIVRNAAITATENRKELLPDADDFTQLELDSYASSSDNKASVTEVYKANNDTGYVMTCMTKSFGGDYSALHMALFHTLAGGVDARCRHQGSGSRIPRTVHLQDRSGRRRCQKRVGLQLHYRRICFRYRDPQRSLCRACAVCCVRRCEIMEERKRIDVLLNGLIKENPVLVLVIGTCPTLATSTSVETGFGMGLAATAVLVCSNIVISALHNIIPDKVRIPCFITVIAGFVTIVQMLLQAFVPSLYSALGLYLPLIVVNCIILGRAEMFASKNGVLDSALDGIGMGLGFTLTLVIMGTIREVLGSGTWLAGDWFGLAKGFKGIPLLSNFIPGMSIMTMVPGGFFVYAIVMAAVHYFTKDKSKIRNEFGCDGCANAGNCADGECAQK